MAVYNNPKHRVTIYGPPTATRDGGGGTTVTWGTTRQAAVPCVVNTVSGREAERFAQMGLTVSHRIAFLSATLTSSVARGDKVTDDDTSASYHVEGIEKGRAMGSVPAFTYLNVQEVL